MILVMFEGDWERNPSGGGGDKSKSCRGANAEELLQHVRREPRVHRSRIGSAQCYRERESAGECSGCWIVSQTSPQ